MKSNTIPENWLHHIEWNVYYQFYVNILNKVSDYRLDNQALIPGRDVRTLFFITMSRTGLRPIHPSALWGHTK
jgi:hypothetical protein